jgi:hypothetical protein
MHNTLKPARARWIDAAVAASPAPITVTSAGDATSDTLPVLLLFWGARFWGIASVRLWRNRIYTE